MEITPLDEKIALKTELLGGQHFAYTFVFGQGPVQEGERIPAMGREGLNIYSRLTALSAAEMLKAGLTDKVILSGGQTGARAGTNEAKTEAELMADIIRRHIRSGSKEPGTFIANGVKKNIDNVILIENEAKDTLQNVALILNKHHIDANANIAFLGIGFHAHDTLSGAMEGRLEVLADLFGLQATVFSAEGVLRKVTMEQIRDADGNTEPRSRTSFVRNRLNRLTHETLTHPVSILKSQQEAVLVRGLRAGDWLRIAPFLEKRQLMKMLLRDLYVMQALQEQFVLNEGVIREMDIRDMLDKLKKLKVEGSRGYGEVKDAVFQALDALGKATGNNYLGIYGKATHAY